MVETRLEQPRLNAASAGQKLEGSGLRRQRAAGPLIPLLLAAAAMTVGRGLATHDGRKR